MATAYRINLYGPFDIVDGQGASIRPAGRKACALLALLACSPTFSRTRAWLQAHLWSDRGEQQASSSLRQAVWQIRNRLPQNPSLLYSDQYYISLDRTSVQVQRFGVDADLEFLEGIDVRDEAFEEWLRIQRARAQEEILKTAGREVTSSGHSVAMNRPAHRCTDSAGIPSVLVMPVADFSGSREIRHAAEVAVDHLALGLYGHGLTNVVDLRETVFIKDQLDFDANTAPNFLLRVTTSSVGSEFEIAIQLSNTSERKLIACNVFSGNLDDSRAINPEKICEFIGQSIEVIHEAMFQSSYTSSAAQAIFLAACKFFSCSRECQAEARDVFCRLQDETGLAQAYLAYSYVVANAECLDRNSQENEERILAHCAKALETGPVNPVVHAIVGHLNAFHFRDLETAESHNRRARNGGRNIPLVWSLSAMHRIYAGDFDAALNFARRASVLGTHSPFKFFFDTDEMIAYSLTEKHEEAIKSGEGILKRNPGFLAVMRHLVASYAATGRTDQAQALITTIQRRDPKFSHSGVASKGYHLPSPRSVELIQHAFETVG